jgi:hypothetical protein
MKAAISNYTKFLSDGKRKMEFNQNWGFQFEQNSKEQPQLLFSQKQSVLHTESLMYWGCTSKKQYPCFGRQGQ